MNGPTQNNMPPVAVALRLSKLGAALRTHLDGRSLTAIGAQLEKEPSSILRREHDGNKYSLFEAVKLAAVDAEFAASVRVAFSFGAEGCALHLTGDLGETLAEAGRMVSTGAEALRKGRVDLSELARLKIAAREVQGDLERVIADLDAASMTSGGGK